MLAALQDRRSRAEVQAAARFGRVMALQAVLPQDGRHLLAKQLLRRRLCAGATSGSTAARATRPAGNRDRLGMAKLKTWMEGGADGFSVAGRLTIRKRICPHGLLCARTRAVSSAAAPRQRGCSTVLAPVIAHG